MKKGIITLGLWLLASGLWAQNDEGAKIVPVSQAIQNKNVTIQVGLPYLGDNSVERISNPSLERRTNPLDIRFPWDVLYFF
jgi:hypothetical protein